MTKHLAPAFLVCFATGCSWLVGCGSDSTAGTDTDASSDTGGDNGFGTGGASAGGKSGNKGGSGGSSSGGAVGSGGAASGGASSGGAASGGATSGGAVGSGGATSGGAVGSGGAASSGGALGSGGAASGGAVGSGGASSGGTVGSGGAGTGGAGTGAAGTGDAGTGGPDGGSACGNGVIDPGEQCEPPNAAYCNSTCQFSSACTTCESANCGTVVSDCTNGANADLCILALQCARQAACFELDPGICYCGATDIVACQQTPLDATHGPHGPCITEYNLAASAPNPSQVLLDLTDPSTALGRAGFIQQCDNAFCNAECLP